MAAVRPAAPATPPPSAGPRRYGTVQMQAIELDDRPSGAIHEPVVPSGRNLDDSLDFDFDIDADSALDLDCLPSSHGTRVETPRWSRLEPPSVTRRSSSTSMVAVRRSSTTTPAVDAHAALVAFAGFGDAPAGLFSYPGYALRVLRRRRVLKRDLEGARHRRSQDVGLYEASLRTADDRAVRKGLVLLATLIFMATGAALALVHVVAGLLSVRG